MMGKYVMWSKAREQYSPDSFELSLAADLFSDLVYAWIGVHHTRESPPTHYGSVLPSEACECGLWEGIKTFVAHF